MANPSDKKEKEKIVAILLCLGERIISVVKFLAKQNLAFRGSPNKLFCNLHVTRLTRSRAATAAQQIRPEDGLVFVHWDGKIISDYHCSTKVERLPVLVSAHGNEKLLGVQQMQSETYFESGIWWIKKKWQILTLLACRHHVLEIILSKVFKLCSSPDIPIFNQFKIIWLPIDRSCFKSSDKNSTIPLLPAALKQKSQRYDDYLSLCVVKLRVVNDIAERGVKLFEEHNQLITKNEDEKQDLLQIVEANRKSVPTETTKKLQFMLLRVVDHDFHLDIHLFFRFILS
ncbi:unnamed protein product [Brassicogethes aeneus]|uniref:Uncharacterized protein n=1 Tax=Brassicogethes aeneus TaxID=1431903 RepID=A0A9P0B2S0_BRAAE|nr:unnamed protein product [Brassicogethes aeneus]